MQEPGIDEHEWETRWQDLELLLSEGPAEALGELDALIEEMMVERGYPTTERPGETLVDPERTRDFAEARRTTRLVDVGESVDPGDIAAAVESYRELYALLLGSGPTAGSPA